MFVVVGVTGGIAAYKTVQVVRSLVLAGHDVHVVPTENALRFVGQPTWEAISRHPVTTSVHDDVAAVRHVAIGQAADLVIVAPATANTLAKMAAGMADDLLGTTLLATKAPVVVAPAMHTEMWMHPATVANMATLRERGVHVIGPDAGALTGTDIGPGRMTEPDEIVAFALSLVEREQDLAGLHVVVSTGGTREPLDPVRYLGNRSSGRQGTALARAAADRGARVTLVAAHVDDGVLEDAMSPRISLVRAGTTADLGEAVRTAASGADVVVMAAAVADYRPAEVADRKLAKESSPGARTIELVETEDILAGLGRDRVPGRTIVGFAAETAPTRDELLERGRRKLARKGADLLVLNEVGWSVGFESASNAVIVLGADGDVAVEASGSKRAVADAVWDAVLASRMDRPAASEGRTISTGDRPGHPE
ncbi:bifunctional phosphopantothenoylcysteine decarboxylase/phosphopantothenate--cysteine ligase CoaBC [Microbacterium sp. ASV49]|uniref:Coenzyme A biosynthesis bifunctional protein CoaBC n=1 Tax=Microbacterium candidum TaxID=3041922 RepID=A0ABT7MVN2_9MICO|nr:bifunctional phosphopantothenoylcysteine decarboxylase/phosphopantothenate--cysteine ligase CoaBC [Microbacterium sp. ASV49]MDL9978504.1 bifunctional phosphopantothenoylcysteine decarboxylase/phosphopantothenate--cysteine ligase CoaBC [Microbacterium sp. ASV49]